MTTTHTLKHGMVLWSASISIEIPNQTLPLATNIMANIQLMFSLEEHRVLSKVMPKSMARTKRYANPPLITDEMRCLQNVLFQLFCCYTRVIKSIYIFSVIFETYFCVLRKSLPILICMHRTNNLYGSQSVCYVSPWDFNVTLVKDTIMLN